MSGSSIGPINTGRPKYGECRYCWDENHTRDTGSYFESRQRMIGPVCKHRLHRAKRPAIPSLVSRINAVLFEKMNARIARGEGTVEDAYWYRRALWPDYCGEFAELSIHCTPDILARIVAGQTAPTSPRNDGGKG